MNELRQKAADMNGDYTSCFNLRHCMELYESTEPNVGLTL